MIALALRGRIIRASDYYPLYSTSACNSEPTVIDITSEPRKYDRYLHLDICDFLKFFLPVVVRRSCIKFGNLRSRGLISEHPDMAP